MNSIEPAQQLKVFASLNILKDLCGVTLSLSRKREDGLEREAAIVLDR